MVPSAIAFIATIKHWRKARTALLPIAAGVVMVSTGLALGNVVDRSQADRRKAYVAAVEQEINDAMREQRQVRPVPMP